MRRFLFYWVLVINLLGLPALLTACSSPTGDEKQAIVQAIQQYLAEDTPAGPFTVIVQQVDEPYARVLIEPEDGNAETATAFLKRDNGMWQVLTIGTAFDRETYDELEIPVSLRV